MNESTLSNRLQAVLKLVPTGFVFVDIGTDHAYLPIAAILSGIASRVIAGDVRNGPWQVAKQHIEQAGVEHLIEVRLGDGLDVVQAGEVDAVTICGMGGPLIRDILQQGYNSGKLQGVKRLILQPNIGELTVRRWLRENAFVIIHEEWVEEDGYVYPILCAEPTENQFGGESALDNQLIICPDGCTQELRDAIADVEWQDRLGWLNLLRPSRGWWVKWSREWNKGEAIIRSLHNAQSDESKERLIRLEFEQLILGEVLLRWKTLTE